MTTRVSWYQKGKTNLDFTVARDSEWQWHQLGHMQVCTLLQRDNHASTPPLCVLQAGCPSCRPTNSVKALKATTHTPRRLYILCWRELNRRRLLPAVSPAAGHLTTSTVAGLPGLCEISAQRLPRLAQFNPCWVHTGLLALSGQE